MRARRAATGKHGPLPAEPRRRSGGAGRDPTVRAPAPAPADQADQADQADPAGQTELTRQVEDDCTTIDSLAHYVARHLEDGASADHDVRRRYGRLVGLLAHHAERAYARVRRR